VRWNPRFLAYAGHYGFRPVACTPARGNEKVQASYCYSSRICDAHWG
jgi:transposase